MFRAATAGIDTAPHVAQVLGGGQEEGEEQPNEGMNEQEQAEAEAQAQAEAEAQA